MLIKTMHIQESVYLNANSNRNPVSSFTQSLGDIPPENVVFGRSDVMRSVHDRLIKVAGANVPVLIQGESGTGKDIIAGWFMAFLRGRRGRT